MHWRPPQAARRHSVRALAMRTVGAMVLAGLLAAAVIGLITSGGIQQASIDDEEGAQRSERPQGARKQLDGQPDARLLRLQQDIHGLLQQRAASARAKKSLYDTDDFRAQLANLAAQPPGDVSRLQSSVEQPLGPPGPGNPLCAPFVGRPRTVAIVGNGPLSAADRQGIEAHGLVVRFNLMNNWQRFRERADVWVMRFSVEAAAGYWGINNIRAPESEDVIALLKGVWLVGGDQSHADRLLARHPGLAVAAPVLLPEAPMNKAFAADLLAAPAAYPSTGFVGVQAALHCAAPDAVLHLYGFNWSRRTWSGHDMDAERQYVRHLESAGRAVVHPTACGGMRECGGGDINASCHWTRAGRYLCLGGKPRKWIDRTSQVAADRRREFRADVSATGRQAEAAAAR